ncbi:MAG TPA: P-loop NTPase [Chloroflexia bacterium]|nr:P-loop NTPase [Chloroflexia bacterium]
MSEETRPITPDMIIKKVVENWPETVRVFAKHGLGCITCSVSAYDTIAKGARAHKIDYEPLLVDLNLVLEKPELFPEVKTGGLAAAGNGGDDSTTAQIKNIIAIVSGKGGVGKSFVTSSLAIGLNRMGMRVGILDADITGPSIPRTFGITARPAQVEGGSIIPVISSQGIKIMSSLFFVENEDQAIIWRGPLISKLIKDFYNSTLWGELDYLLVDLPPGTSDAPLTVMQSLPTNGIVLVSSPQLLATSIVKKAIRLADKMRTPIIGVAENMSWLTLPDSGKKLNLFGPSRAEELSQAANAPVLARLPLDPNAAELVDAGRLEDYNSLEGDTLAGNFVVAAKERMRSRQLSIS